MTSKQRAYLKGLAMTMDPIFQFGKNSLTPENTAAIAEALEARELIKITVPMTLEKSHRWLQKEHAHRLFRLLERKSFFTRNLRTTKKSFYHD